MSIVLEKSAREAKGTELHFPKQADTGQMPESIDQK